jgi:uncharacterized repeat protein (TIGR03803 family)
MNYRRLLGDVSAALMIVIAIVMLAPGTLAQSKYTTLYAFNGTDGQNPFGSLNFDQAGNLYGTTFTDSVDGAGTVFKLNQSRNGSWKEKVLHRFKGKDGRYPGANLIFDAAGNLYGTTGEGGSSSRCRDGCGVVFKLTPNPNGSWKEKLLYQFGKGGTQDGAHPFYSGLIFDQAGSLYGTTEAGGATDHGVVFKLTPNPDGSWTESVLYSFCPIKSQCRDGSNPAASLIFDRAGNLYGTTIRGGAHRAGTVFELTPKPDGSWTEGVLYHFSGGSDGRSPWAGLILDQAGNLYGTTREGGSGAYGCSDQLGCGTAFKLAPNPDGSWTASVLHSFCSLTNCNDGASPFNAGLILDQAGNLYGTTERGGDANGGVVFKVTSNPNGTWTEDALHSFCPFSCDGYQPDGNLIFDKAGNLYGTTFYGNGIVFKLTP